MPGYSRLPLVVEVDITDETLTLSTGERRIGDWPLKDVQVSSRSDGFHLRLDDEEVVLSVAEAERFISAMGMANPPSRSATVRAISQARDPRAVAGRGRLSITPDEDDFDDMKRRIDELSHLVVSDETAPEEVFGRWIRLLKEINLRHGQGAMPTPLFYRLNTQLLDLIPEPSRPRPAPVA